MNTDNSAAPDWALLRTDTRLGELDRQLGEFLAELDGDSPWLKVAAALASRAAARGEIYFDLSEIPAFVEPWPGVGQWREQLLSSSVVGEAGSHRALVLDARDRLYLHRFWVYQQDLARDLRARAALRPRRFNGARLQRTLDRLDASVTGFGAMSPLILATAALCRICVVQASASIWAELLSSLLVVVGGQLGRRLNVLVAGPGAQRNALESLLARAAKDPNLLAEERLQWPAEPITLEHLPRDRRRSHQGSYGEEPPMRVDLVMVVGAEAADLVMLANLVRVLPPYTRLVLLGDVRGAPRPEHSPFAALLAGPGQSDTFRRRLGWLLGENLALGSEPVNALQNAVVTPLLISPAVADGGLYQAFWEDTGGDREVAEHNPEEDQS